MTTEAAAVIQSIITSILRQWTQAEFDALISRLRITCVRKEDEEGAQVYALTKGCRSGEILRAVALIDKGLADLASSKEDTEFFITGELLPWVEALTRECESREADDNRV